MGIILAFSLVLMVARFAVSGGKAILCADSIQYADNAIALIEPDGATDFAFRKPGYSFLLALVLAFTGSLGWTTIGANYLLLSLWPAGAYLLAVLMADRRGAAWLAALATAAGATTFLWADRMMSECLYGTLLLVALILAAWALKDETVRPGRLVPVGIMLALAWLTRSAGVSVMAALLVITLWRTRSAMPLMMRAVAAMLLPLGIAVALECDMNNARHGAFRPCTGTLGPMMLMRACALQGDPLTEGPGGSACAALLPERAPTEAFVAHNLDVWIARDRAIRLAGLTEWQADELFARAAREVVAAHPGDYLATSLRLVVHASLRRPLAAECVAPQRTAAPISHPLAADDERFEDRWFAYWALSHRTNDDALRLTDELERQSSRRAPFTPSQPWATLRYVFMRAHVAGAAAVIGGVLLLWPLVTLPLCLWLAPGRRATIVVGAALAADVLLIGLTAPSIDAFQRFIDVWMPVDGALSGTSMAWAITILAPRVRVAIGESGASASVAPLMTKKTIETPDCS